MKVAVTGHTKGIGLSLFEYFQQDGNTCLGFSRTNGYNISDKDNRTKIVEESSNCDIFVNNAYSNFDDSQLYLLQSIYNKWAGQDKLIINISSRITDWPVDLNEGPAAYYETKTRQDQFCAGKRSFPQILNLRVGITDTQRVQHFSRNKMNPADIIDAVKFAITSKNKFRVTSMTFGL